MHTAPDHAVATLLARIEPRRAEWADTADTDVRDELGACASCSPTRPPIPDLGHIPVGYRTECDPERWLDTTGPTRRGPNRPKPPHEIAI